MPEPVMISDPALDLRVRAALEEVRPMLQSDGGDIVYLGIAEGHLARVQLLGACSSCPSSTITLQMGVESFLREQVPEINGLLVDAPAAGGHGGWGGIF